jgi:hypothetical protein
MKLVLVVEIPDQGTKRISENSIERVINMSIELAQRSKHSDSFVNEDDWRELKPYVVNLWVRLQDAIFRQVNGIEDQQEAQREIDNLQTLKEYNQRLKESKS